MTLHERFPLAAASHFEGDKTMPSSGKVKIVQGDDDLQKPTAGEYAAETAKGFLKILEVVAQAIPVPGVGTAVKTAVYLITVCEESHATLDRAQELKLRIKTLVTVLVNDLKGKKADEIQDKLKDEVKALERDLNYIQGKLNEIASQRGLRLVLFRSFNEDKVRKCLDRLNTSLESFNLSRQLNQANVLNDLEKQILNFYARQQKALDHLQDTVDDVKVTMDDMKFTVEDVKAVLNTRLPAASSSSRPSMRAVMPANTGIFHGRDALVADLVSSLTYAPEGQKSPRACLLGPGGMGKTSTALAIMAHPDLKKRFPDRNQVWVPCVKAVSVSLFFDTLYSSLGVTRNTGNTRNDVLAELEASEPLILLLDNFETPWNVDGGRSEIARALRDIDQIPHIALFITMRSSIPPCDGIHWTSVDLKAVDSDAARQIYLDINPSGSKDPDLPGLLEVIGHMPLAITLMAKVGKLTGLSAEKLAGEYNRLGTAMLGQGSDAEHSMDICISLSVYGPSMKQHPEAFDLLAALATLPVGTTYDMLANWWARDSPNLIGALEVLRETFLVERRESTFFVLPVIRRFILSSSRFPDKVRTFMIESACTFLAEHKSAPGEDVYKHHTAVLSDEEANLQAILLQTTTPTPDLIKALITLALHQEMTRPRTDVIQHALDLVRGMANDVGLLGAVLSCYGAICVKLDRYDDARRHFALARNSFLSILARKEAAGCLLKLVDVHLYDNPQHARDRALIAEAQFEFESIEDRHGVALCLYYLGRLQWQFGYTGKGSHSEAIELFHRARAELEDVIDATECAYYLAQAYFWEQQYEEAQTWATSVMQECDRIGRHDHASRAKRMIAHCRIVEGDYEVALKMLIQLLERSRSYGVPMGVGFTLEEIGRTWAKMGKKEDARRAFEECLRMYSSLKVGESAAMRCQYFLRKLEDPLSSVSEDELRVLTKWYPEDIEDLL